MEGEQNRRGLYESRQREEWTCSTLVCGSIGKNETESRGRRSQRLRYVPKYIVRVRSVQGSFGTYFLVDTYLGTLYHTKVWGGLARDRFHRCC